MNEPAEISPDFRDWTFVITDGCQECGFAPQPPATTGDRLRATIPTWQAALADPRAGHRPVPGVWSAVEYGCHVRDACRIFRQRLERMLTEDNPTFANWDQDATAVEDRYFEQRATTVAQALVGEAETTAAAFDSVEPEQWLRPGRRSNGSAFSVATLAIYFLHDVEHHISDVSRTE